LLILLQPSAALPRNHQPPGALPPVPFFSAETLKSLTPPGNPVDGSLEALWTFQLFIKGGERNSFIDSEMKPLDLTEAEVDDLVGFLSALTSDRFSALRARGTGPATYDVSL
jgi:hypothetical protein